MPPVRATQKPAEPPLCFRAIREIRGQFFTMQICSQLLGGRGPRPRTGLRGSSWINGFSSGFDPRISVHPRPNSTGATCSSVFGVQRARAEILSQLLSPGARCQPIWRSGNASTGVRALYSPRRPGVHGDARESP